MTSRRPALAAAALTASLLLGGCGLAQRTGAAGVVNGHPISTSEVSQATRQLNTLIKDPTRKVSERQTAALLALAPFILDVAARTGTWAPDNAYNSNLALIQDPAPSTITLLKTQLALSALARDETLLQQAFTEASRADIQLDPRYGQLTLPEGRFEQRVPNWIKPVTDPNAPAAPGQQQGQ